MFESSHNCFAGIWTLWLLFPQPRMGSTTRENFQVQAQAKLELHYNRGLIKTPTPFAPTSQGFLNIIFLTTLGRLCSLYRQRCLLFSMILQQKICRCWFWKYVVLGVFTVGVSLFYGLYSFSLSPINSFIAIATSTRWFGSGFCFL